MGSDLYFETNKAQQDVFGNHATAFDCNMLVAMNESSMKYNTESKISDAQSPKQFAGCSRPAAKT